MRILFAASEVYPLVKTGGLADACGALPNALVRLGVDVRLVVPGYPPALDAAVGKQVEAKIACGRSSARLIHARTPDTGLPLWLVDCPDLFDRDGTPYLAEDGSEWPDNAQRFAAFNEVAARLALGELVPNWRADVVHGNDWQCGLLPLLLTRARGERPASLFSIHNIAYQGLFPASILPSLPVPAKYFHADGVEFYGKLSFLKAGIRFSDRVTTVSPSYAREILTPEYGCGLDGLLRSRAGNLRGILNGVDYSVWNPKADIHLPTRYDSCNLAGKQACKIALQRELGLAIAPKQPLAVSLSRITDQKMADIVLHALPSLLERNIQLALLGQGDHGLEAQFREAAEHYPGRLAIRIGYEEPLAHRFLGGADMLLHPSRFEPCGLTPLYAMRYGALPVVRHVGGLADTIIDATEWTVQAGNATGFSFREITVPAMLACLDRALALYTQPETWAGLQRRAMSREFCWGDSARRYLTLYRGLAPHAIPPVENFGHDVLTQSLAA